MGQSRWIDDDQIQRKRTPSFPSHESVVWRNAQKQRRWKIICTLLWRWWYDWNCFSHNYVCSSAQYLRSSLRILWRVQYLSNKHKETCCGRAIRPILRASKLIDNDTHTFDWDSFTRKSIAETQRKRGKLSTTRSIDKSLYWRRIPWNSWSRTINTSWQNILTSSYNLQSQWHVVSMLYHEMKNQLTRKVGFKGTPKLDPCWKSQPVADKVNTQWKSELNLWTTTIITRGLEYLMAWTIWSQTWSTGSTTTTSRRPPQLVRKYFRLQADPRLKQNQEDLQLLVHLQGPYLFVKEHGLILNQELNPIKRTQWQRGETLFFGMENYLEKKMERSNSRDWKMIFRTHLSIRNISLMMYGRTRWKDAGATIKDFHTVLTRQDKKFFTFELFKVVQDAISLILHCRTMYWFRTISSSTFNILDVQSICIPSRIQDW